MYVFKNPNPNGSYVGDCVIRAISIATGKEWDEVYLELMLIGYEIKDMPNANEVWGLYLRHNGFTRESIPNTCPDCYTVRDFVADNPVGTFVLGTGTHAICVKQGNYYDTADSGDEVPVYVWKKEV